MLRMLLKFYRRNVNSLSLKRKKGYLFIDVIYLFIFIEVDIVLVILLYFYYYDLRKVVLCFKCVIFFQILKGFLLIVVVDFQYYLKIIGRKGERVKKIREEYDVIIQFFRENDVEQNSIIIIGYEKNVEVVKDIIFNIVCEYVRNL